MSNVERVKHDGVEYIVVERKSCPAVTDEVLLVIRERYDESGFGRKKKEVLESECIPYIDGHDVGLAQYGL